MKKSMKTIAGVVLMLLLSATQVMNAQNAQDKRALLKEAKAIVAGNKQIEQLLEKFDTLDFVVFSHQEWQRLHESHAENIKVHFPDGHVEEGLKKHIETLAAMFVYAPDTRVTEHPLRIGQGNITAVTGWMTGTFTKPMPIGNGKFIQPTGKSFRIPMATFGIWENGVMTEEYLFWDNKAYMDQLGIGQ